MAQPGHRPDLIGTAGLTVGGGLRLPTRWLDGTGFASYFWPGVFLGVVQALAVIAQRGCFED